MANFDELVTGLRYEDLLIEEDRSVEEALSLTDKDVFTTRTRRAKRAIDLSFKKKDLSVYAPNMAQAPYKTELMEDIEKLQARDAEFVAMNNYLN